MSFKKQSSSWPVKSKISFNGKLLKLYQEYWRLPNGKGVLLEVIRHPGAVLIVPFLSRDRIVLIRQYRPVIHSYIWELPAGTFHGRETALHCARRELAEETGYGARIFHRLGIIYPAPGYATEKIIIFEARGLKRIPANQEEDEVITSKIFSARQIRYLYNSSRIQDAKTICGLKLAGVI